MIFATPVALGSVFKYNISRLSFLKYTMSHKTIEVTPEVYNALQRLKEVFKELTGQEVKEDSEVISVLASGFIDSLTAEGEHDHEADHAHHHNEKKGACCGGACHS